MGLRFLLLNAGFEAQKADEDSRTSSSGETGWSTGELMVQKSGEAADTVHKPGCLGYIGDYPLVN